MFFGTTADVRSWRIVLKKSFLTDRRNFSGPLVRSARGDVGTTSFLTKSTIGCRIDPTGPCSNENIEESTLATVSAQSGRSV
jgi:hypothetical protein